MEGKRIAEMGAWFIGGFCTGLRGEEMLLIKLAGTANSLSHLLDEKMHTLSMLSRAEPKVTKRGEQSLESRVFQSLMGLIFNLVVG